MSSISVIMSTYNRAEVLRETLESMRLLDMSDFDVQFIVADNNSSDDTPEVLEYFKPRLPLRSIHAANPGKNRALNAILDTCPLGDIVVFTDDDVAPDPLWLQEIHAATERWQDISVFGGRIEVRWPVSDPPNWALSEPVLHWGFAHTDWQDHEGLLLPDRVPAGPNMWIRRSLLDAGFRFDELLGPRPEGTIMGDETAFLLELRSAGFEIVMVPSAVVFHRIQTDALDVPRMRKRARSNGRGLAHLKKGIGERDFRTPVAPQCARSVLACLKRWTEALCWRGAVWNPERVTHELEARRWAAYHEEVVRLRLAIRANFNMRSNSTYRQP